MRQPERGILTTPDNPPLEGYVTWSGKRLADSSGYYLRWVMLVPVIAGKKVGASTVNSHGLKLPDYSYYLSLDFDVVRLNIYW